MEIYGLIGETLAHSFSQKYFTNFFKEEKLENYQYQNFELKNLELEIPYLKKLSNLGGLNVTIPYKSDIIPFLDEITDECREIGACNCINIKNGKWTGHNTDVTGFQKTFSPHLKPYHKGALILGSGGASRAVSFVLNKLKLPFLTISRKDYKDNKFLRYEEITEELMRSYPVIINTTPLGMFPKEGIAPDIPYEHANASNYFYDLIYNPERTLFLQKGVEKGASIENGSQMLIIQAKESWRIWNS